MLEGLIKERMMSNIVHLKNAVQIYGDDPALVVEICNITPEQAALWLECNKHNRPLRRRHVAFLAGEIMAGNWQVNGQAIIISDDEAVLDGQHRLQAIIEAGTPVKSFVVYGIKPEAFKTIDTGIVRTGADALTLHFPELQTVMTKNIATAVQWCAKFDAGHVNSNLRTSNTDVILYVKEHPSLINLAATLYSYPKDARPLSIGPGLALYEIFSRKKSSLADDFMRRLYTGEGLERTDPEFILRGLLQKDARQISKLPTAIKIRMIIKGWNLRRRGLTKTSSAAVKVSADDPQKIVIM